MKSSYVTSPLISAVITLAMLPRPGYAVEGALGRPVSGTQINPYAGLVPPAPGLALSVGEIYYDGDIGGQRTIPIANLLALNLEGKLSFTPITALYIWDTGTNRWNFASAISFPLAWLEVAADVSVGGVTRETKDSEFGLFDLTFVPIVASYHISQTEHLAFNFTVWAPTGEYEVGKLANLSLNNWTFIPGAAYTRILPKQNLELSASYS